MRFREPDEHEDEDDELVEDQDKDVAVDMEFDAEEGDEGVSRWRFEQADAVDRMDAQMGFERHMSPQIRKGWLINMHATLVRDEDWPGGRSALDGYFLEEDGGYFKATLVHSPYFYVRSDRTRELEDFVRKQFGSLIEKVSVVELEDLDVPNHLTGLKVSYVKLTFRNVTDLMSVRQPLLAAAAKNKERRREEGTFGGVETGNADILLAYEDEEGRDGGRRRPRNAARNGLSGLASVLDVREYDVPYIQRVCMDHDLRAGLWYSVRGGTAAQIQREVVQGARPDPIILAFDIETTKAPLKFPDASHDVIMMLSYVVDGRGHLLVNRTVVGADIQDFEYAPSATCAANFKIYNAVDERDLLTRFIAHLQALRPTVIVTYNGDSFDWPFVATRAAILGLPLDKMLGVVRNAAGDAYTSTFAVQMDAFRWVQRDAYLPHGSQGLKAVAAVKLGFSPLEVDPELMMTWAAEKSQDLAAYSASDALCTFYLYMQYVHPFIFALCTVVPLPPDDVLRKGSGTLCEALLMAESCAAHVIMPNKHRETLGKLVDGRLLASETYVGGHVAALASGIYRSDLPVRFTLQRDALEVIREDLDAILNFGLQHAHVDRQDLVDYEDVRHAIDTKLIALVENDGKDKDALLKHENAGINADETDDSECENQLHSQQETRPKENSRTILDLPLLYHLDVAAMYPNIMLTNRLQPPSIVTERTCAVCDYNRPGKTCQRRMDWQWRTERFMAKKNELSMLQQQLEAEQFHVKATNQGYPGKDYRTSDNGSVKRRKGIDTGKSGEKRFTGEQNKFKKFSKVSNLIEAAALIEPALTTSFDGLSLTEQNERLKTRLADYCRRVYGRVHETRVETQTSIVCQRENSFYVDTVRQFRDRRDDYKAHLRDAKRLAEEAIRSGDAGRIAETQKAVILYDSLQLAHKCILNSFYGYVMRKGSRWYSMEMAGIVCHTGAAIIRLARAWLERIGAMPLELDTDGIWCLLPAAFPDTISLTRRDGSKVRLSFPCLLLNRQVHASFTNHQYEVRLPNGSGGSSVPRFRRSSENSIFFEIDGPYRAMILPASTEEDRLLKKRYAVFHMDGRLAELKGFEVKRRGELPLTKRFQTDLFQAFLLGSTLRETYAAAASVARHWLTILDTRGAGMNAAELIDLLAERKTMSKPLAAYGNQKSTAITTARRLVAFLGEAVDNHNTNSNLNTASNSTFGSRKRQVGGQSGAIRGALTCTFIISARPHGQPVAQRAIPTAIFAVEDPATRHHFLSQWLGDTLSTTSTTYANDDPAAALSDILDWQYYKERFVALLQRLITIPAALQHVDNPLRELPLPPWLKKRHLGLDGKRQLTLHNVSQDVHSIDKSIGRQESKSGETDGNSEHADSNVNHEFPETCQMDEFQVSEPKNTVSKVVLGLGPLSERVDFRSIRQKEADAEKLRLTLTQKQQEAALLARLPSISLRVTPYAEWLQCYKLVWRQQRTLRASKGPNIFNSAPRHSVGSQQKSQSQFSESFQASHIVQVKGKRPDAPLDVWLLVPSKGDTGAIGKNQVKSFQLKRLSLDQPYTFYIQLRDNAPSQIDLLFESKFKRITGQEGRGDIIGGGGALFQVQLTAQECFRDGGYEGIWTPFADKEVWAVRSLLEHHLSRTTLMTLSLGNCVSLKNISKTSEKIASSSSTAAFGLNISGTNEWHPRPDVTPYYLGEECHMVPVHICYWEEGGKRLLFWYGAQQCLLFVKEPIPTLTKTALQDLLLQYTRLEGKCGDEFFENFSVQIHQHTKGSVRHWYKFIQTTLHAILLTTQGSSTLRNGFQRLAFCSGVGEKSLLDFLADRIPLIQTPGLPHAGVLLGDRWVREHVSLSLRVSIYLENHLYPSMIGLSRLAHLPIGSLEWSLDGISEDFINMAEDDGESDSDKAGVWFKWRTQQRFMVLDHLFLRQWRILKYILPEQVDLPGLAAINTSSRQRDPPPIALHKGATTGLSHPRSSLATNRDLVWGCSPPGIYNQSGAYTTICFDIQLSGVLVNALLTSSSLSLPHSGTLDADQSASSMDSGMKAWRTLQLMIASLCHTMATQRTHDTAHFIPKADNPATSAVNLATSADSLVSSLDAWLYGQQQDTILSGLLKAARMHADRSIQQTLDNLKRYIHSLGATVIHLTPTRLLLATKKGNRDNAIAFLTYLVTHLSKSSNSSTTTSSSTASDSNLFMKGSADDEDVAKLAWLQFSTQKVLRHVLWYNQDNYYIQEDGDALIEEPVDGETNPKKKSFGKKKGDEMKDRIDIDETDLMDKENKFLDQHSSLMDKENMDDDASGNEVLAPVVRYRWLLAEAKLPMALQAPFYAIVRTFMAHLVQEQENLIRRTKRTKILRLANGLTAPLSGGLFSDPLDEAEVKQPQVQAEQSEVEDEDEEKVYGDGRKMLPQEITLKLFKLVQEVQAHYYKEVKGLVASNATSNSTTADVPLTFIQLAVALLLLDPSYEIHGRALRKQWLHMLSIPEFSPQATFSPLIPILVVPTPPCPFCLSAGPYRQVALYPQEQLCNFSCADCQRDMPLDLIAQQTQVTLTGLLLAHLNQDAVCRHCRLPKEFPCLSYCPHCKGEPYSRPESSLPKTIQQLRTLHWLPLHDFFDTRFIS